MKKRILSLVLALSMMISLFPVSALAQPPGGGTAVLAEENGTTYDGPLEIDNDPDSKNYGKPTTEGGENWTYEDSMLTLNSGTYNFSGKTVTCYVKVCSGATVAGGIFENTVWNEAGGKISGGTFADVSNRGTIIGGTFTGAHGSIINHTTIAGGVFEKNVTNGDSGDEGISASITGGLFKAEVQNKAASAAITGGVFVTKPTGSGTIANGYTLTTSGRTSKFLYAADGKEIDLGQSVYVIPNNTDALKVVGDGVSNWDVADGSGTYALTNWDGVTLKQDGSFTLNPDKISGTTLKFTVSTTPVTPDPELVLAGGVPDTSTEHAKQKTVGGKTIYYGNGWEYDGTTLKLNPTSAKEFTLNSAGTTIKGAYLNCDLEIGENATVKGTIALTRKVTNNGTIDKLRFGGDGEGHYPSLTNNGTVQNCSIEYASVTNNKKMENVSIVACSSLENTANATIENVVVRKFGKEISYSNLGSIDNAVFEFNPKIDNVHVLKASSGETVGATLSGIKAVVFGTEVYIVGEPEVKVKISGDNAETITDVNGNKAYGGLESGKDSEGFQKFIVQSGDKELVLNKIGAPDPSEVEHTLTLNDAVIVKEHDSTATTGEYKEGTTVKIKPQINDSKKVFSRWSTDPEESEAIVPNHDTEGTYTLTMPDHNLTVEACSVYKSYPLNVVDGTLENTFGNMVEWGTYVAVKAASAPAGKYFAGWKATETGTDTAVTLRDWSGKVIDLMDENLTTLRFPMPDKAVTLTAVYKDCEKKLVMKADGTPDLTHVYKENGRRYVGDGWWYFSVEDGSEVNALYLSPDALTEYDFAHTDPIGKTGTLEAVNCIIVEYNANATIVGGTFAEEVDNRGTIWNGIFKGKVYNGDVPYSATIKNGTFMGEVINSNNSTITGGVFAGGVKRSETDVISGGIFNEGTALKGINGAHKIVLEGAQILSINGVSRANGWSNVYTFAETELTVEASQSIYNVNGETTGATGLKTSTIRFTMSDEDAVLNKGVTPDPETKPNPNPTPNPDAQPKTYTVTVKGGKINNETEVKAEKGTKLTVDVDESEVPEGMTFDVWSISFPKGVEDTLTGDPSVMLHDPHMSFAMPEADITIEAQYRSSELPGEDDGPSVLGTMATVAVGGAAAGILVWQGVSLGVDSYLQLNLPKGVAVPANRRELVVLLWETAGKPEAALPSLYSDVPAEEIELQKATRWAIDNGLVKPADDSDVSRFDPDRYVTKYDVFGAWLKLKKLMK